MLERAKAVVKSRSFWWRITLGALATTLILLIVSLMGIRFLVEPPARGQFYEVLQRPALENFSNTTGTLFEETVDRLSGGVIPVLLFPQNTKFCGDAEHHEMSISACVNRFKATFISVDEDFMRSLEWSSKEARDLGKTEEADKVDLWQKHIAAHEFAHILQYNYREKSLPFYDSFEGGFLKSPVEDMAECYAQTVYPINDDTAKKKGTYTTQSFYGFPVEERLALCTPGQQDVIKEWLEAINFPLEGRVVQSNRS